MSAALAVATATCVAAAAALSPAAATAAGGGGGPCALTFSAAPAADLQRLFEQAPTGRLNWLGADVATSIPLNDAGDAFLWQFGDTLLGRFYPNATRGIAAMPRNSVGVLYVNATTGAPTSTLAHAWRLNASAAQHTGFFSPPLNDSQWYWPQVGVRVPGVGSYTVAWRIEPAGGGLFPFATAGVDVIQLPANADGADGVFADPTEWPVGLPTVPLPGYLNNSFTLGNAVAYSASEGGDGVGRVYLLGGLGSPQHAILARITAADWAAFNWGGLEFLVGGGGWAPYSPAIQPATLFADVNSECTLTWLPDVRLWVTLSANTFLSASVTARTAPALAGPWSDPAPVFPIPPYLTSGGGFCYAAKAHPEFSPGGAPGGSLAFTFNCNTPGLGPLAGAPDVYIPRAVRAAYALAAVAA
jgi:hypothetical protein